MPTNPENSGHSTSEVGHAKNVAQFKKLYVKCEIFPEYNPANPLIYMVENKKYHTKCKEIIKLLHQLEGAEKLAVNERQQVFQRLDTIAGSVVNTLTVAANDPKIEADAAAILNKIQGEAPKIKTIENQSGQETKEPRSSSEQSYDKLIDHFEKLLELVRLVDNYIPNEQEMTIPALEAYLIELNSANDKANLAESETEKARRERTFLLYDPKEGLLRRAFLIKRYIQGLFGGTSSEQYKDVNAIRFRKD